MLLSKLVLFYQRNVLLLDVAKLCVEWQLMGKYLKLTEAAVDGDKETVEEKRIAMLGKW